MSRLLSVADRYQKAIGGTVAAGLAATYSALPDGLAKTIVGIVIASLAGGGLTGALPYRTPNAKRTKG